MKKLTVKEVKAWLGEPRYTAAEILAAAEEGEVCMIDARYIVEVLQRSKTTNNE